MKYKPILFSTPMVQAILNGTKTQTRRVVKPQPPKLCDDKEPTIDFDYSIKGTNENPAWFAEWEMPTNESGISESNCVYAPYGKPGDILWVRETALWVMLEHAHDLLEGAKDRNQWVYKARVHEDWIEYAKEKYGYKWKPSIFMPKEACRLFLRVKDVKVQKLQEIKRDDCIAEGIAYHEENWGKWHQVGGSWYDYERKTFASLPCGKISPSMSFMSLWRSINGEQSWDENPFVWVYKFEVIAEPAGWPNL